MILTRLDEILKEKNISINKLSKETGISRKALTSLVNNDSKGIQFQTLDKLITHLNISISDFFRDDRQSLLLSVLPFKEVSHPAYNVDNITDEDGLLDILYLQSTWNLDDSDNNDYYSTPFIALPSMQEEPRKIFGISFRMDSNDLLKADIENFTYIFKNLNEKQLHYVVLEFLNQYIANNKNIRTLLDDPSIHRLPIAISYFEFNELLIFDVTHKSDGSLSMLFDFSSEDDEIENIKIKLTDIDLSKFTKDN